jgi:predicted nuclease of predicted toxin-antitoxin system
VTIPLYMDVHVPKAITAALRSRGLDVLTAQEDGSATAIDDIVLDRAGTLGRAVFTHDKGFLRMATARQRAGLPFSGVIYARQLGLNHARIVEALEVIGSAGEPHDVAGRVEYIP